MKPHIQCSQHDSGETSRPTAPCEWKAKKAKKAKALAHGRALLVTGAELSLSQPLGAAVQQLQCLRRKSLKISGEDPVVGPFNALLSFRRVGSHIIKKLLQVARCRSMS